jgi:CubicO group peptidase (beta-lactamase class C family)
MMKIIWCLITVMFSLSCFAEEIPSTQEIDALAKKTLSEWDIPGLALAIVHKGKPIVVAGYGVKERGKLDAVDENTLFQICSLSKAFTATLIAELVEEGKLSWERPIREYDPAFQLKDQVAKEQMTLRDLLSHRTGLPGISTPCWRLWWKTGRSTDELLSRMGKLDPAHPFRSHFTYTNMAYVEAGRVAEKVTGKPFEQLLNEKIFSPLGMTRTSLSFELLSKDPNAALAYLPRKMQEGPMPRENYENIAPAAGITSTASDMARWMFFCLNTKSAAIVQTQTPQTVLEMAGFVDYFSEPAITLYTHGQNIINYGFGWMIYSLDNKKVLLHTGYGVGMQSILVLVPEEELGIVILANATQQLGAACMMNELLDKFLHRAPVSWRKKAQDVGNEFQRRIDEKKKQIESTKSTTPPTLDLARYVGEYEHPAYGTIRITLDGSLTFETCNQERGTLKPWGGDCFEMGGIPSPIPTLVEFEISSSQVHSLKTEIGIFTRK